MSVNFRYGIITRITRSSDNISIQSFDSRFITHYARENHGFRLGELVNFDVDENSRAINVQSLDSRYCESAEAENERMEKLKKERSREIKEIRKAGKVK